MEWYHVCWPRLTAKRVEPVVSISWASCFRITRCQHVRCKCQPVGVPGIVTVWPWQQWRHWHIQVINAPRQHYDVIDVQQKYNHRRCYTYACVKNNKLYCDTTGYNLPKLHIFMFYNDIHYWLDHYPDSCTNLSLFFIVVFVSLFHWRPSIGLAILCFYSNAGFWPSYCQISTDLDKILHTPTVVRNTLVGELDRDRRSGAAPGQTRTTMFFFISVILVTHPKTYTETTDRHDLGGKPSKWKWWRVLS